MGGRNLIILAAAIGLGLIAVILANAYFSGVEERQERLAAEQQLERIVVATQPLDFGTPLTNDNLKLQNFPAKSVPLGAFRSLDDALMGGRVALRPIVPGEPVLADKVSGSGGRAVLSANLPEDMRAVAVPVSAVSGVAGFVRPGDTVDVILTRKIPGDGAEAEDLMSDVILEKVQVLAIDQTASENATEPNVGKTATLQVALPDAQKLALATRVGSLSLALRNVEDTMFGYRQTVTAGDLSRSGLYIASRAPAPAYSGPVYTGPGPTTGPRRPSGPSMAVFRGVERTEYSVGRLGGQ